MAINMICTKCGHEIPDDAPFCEACGYVTSNYQENIVFDQPSDQYYQPLQQPAETTENPTFQQQEPQYYQPQQNNQNYYQPQHPNQTQPFQNFEHPEISRSRTLGILSIILGIFIPLAGWICGGIGLSKANKMLLFNPFDPAAQKAAKINKIGLIVTSILFAVSVFISFKLSKSLFGMAF